MQAVGDGGGIAQMMIVVEDGIGERLGHVADVLGLGHEVQHTVLDVLQHVRHAVRTVQVHIALLLADEGLITHRLEALPVGDQVLHHADVGARFDIEVAGVEEAAHVQAGDQLEGLEAGVDGTLAVQVEVVRIGRSLEITLLERLTVPDAVAFVDHHMIHVDRNPDVARGVGDAVQDIAADDEIVGLDVAVLDEVHARLLQVAEVELHVVVLVEAAPGLHRAGEGALGGAVVLHAPDFRRGAGLVKLVKLDHGHLLLAGQVAHLREAHVRFADPAGDGVRLHGPAQHLAGLAGRQHAAKHVPAVLRQQAAVVEVHLGVLAGDLDQAARIVRRHDQLMAGGQRKRIHEAAGAAVVVGLVALVLINLLLVGARGRQAGGIAREAVRLAVHHIRLVPVLGRQEFEVETGVALQLGGDRLIQINVDPDGFADRRHDEAGIKVVMRVTQPDLDGAVLAVHVADGRLRDEVPLLRRIGQTHGAALDGTHAMVNDFDTGILFVVEAAREHVAVNQHVHALALEVLQIIELEIGIGRAGAGRKSQQRNDEQKCFAHNGY